MAEVLRDRQRKEVENCPGFIEAFDDLNNHPYGEWRGCVHGCGVRVRRRRIGTSATYIDSIIKEGGEPRCKEHRAEYEEEQKKAKGIKKIDGCENPICIDSKRCAEEQILTQNIDASKTDFNTLRRYFLILMASIDQAIIYNCPNLSKLDERRSEIDANNGSCPSFSRAFRMSKVLGHSVFTCKGGELKCGVEAVRNEHGTVTIEEIPKDYPPCKFAFLAKVEERGNFRACGFGDCATKDICTGYELAKEKLTKKYNAGTSPETLQNICEGLAESAFNARCVNPGAIRELYKNLE